MNLFKALELACLAIASHPIAYLLSHPEYQSSSHNSLYFESDKVSLIASNKFVVCISYILFVSGIFFEVYCWLLGIPLVLILWVLFIRDRFRSLSRGMGAPGYFNFFLVASIFSCILQKHATNYFLEILSISVASLVVVEFGSIFLSAGLFKFFDALRQPSGFTFGMQNPTWSKLYKFPSFLVEIRYVIDNLGPILQVTSGVLLIFGPPHFKSFGLYIISFMFFSITPFCRLSWLCPAIAVNSLILVYLIPAISTPSLSFIFALISFLRICCMFQLFLEYFRKLYLPPQFQTVVNIYKSFMGIIIWKVFTFDLVKFAFPTGYLQSKVNISEGLSFSTIPILERDHFLFLCSNSNVYDAITLASLLSSKTYLDNTCFTARIQKYMLTYKLDKLFFLDLSANPEDNLYRKESLSPFNLANLNEISFNHADLLSREEVNQRIRSQKLNNYMFKS
jgi:hypothetical protein